MANRTTHVTVGIILGLAYIPVEFFVISTAFTFSWVYWWLYWLIGLLLAMLGSEAPDFDALYGFMSHRDIVSHSAIYPGIIFGLCVWWRLTVNDPIIGCFIPFLIGYASHLFLDYFPNIQFRKLRDGGLRIGEKKGTFLMHVPFIYRDREGKTRRTLNVKQTEAWLLINSFLCVAMAVILAIMRYLTTLPTF